LRERDVVGSNIDVRSGFDPRREHGADIAHFRKYACDPSPDCVESAVVHGARVVVGERSSVGRFDVRNDVFTNERKRSFDILPASFGSRRLHQLITLEKHAIAFVDLRKQLPRSLLECLVAHHSA